MIWILMSFLFTYNTLKEKKRELQKTVVLMEDVIAKAIILYYSLSRF